MNILSIQSWVAFGHVGNAAAVFPMQRLGVEAWALNTVQFSNHTGYGKWRGQVFSGEHVRELVQGIEERGVLPTCTGVLSGYMGDAGIGEAILDALARVRRARWATKAASVVSLRSSSAACRLASSHAARLPRSER